MKYKQHIDVSVLLEDLAARCEAEACRLLSLQKPPASSDGDVFKYAYRHGRADGVKLMLDAAMRQINLAEAAINDEET